MDRTKIKGTIFILLSAICFSLGGVLIKSIPWNAMSINGMRCIFSLLVMLLYMKATGHPFRMNRAVLFGAVCNFVMGLSFVLATKMTSAANAIVLQFTEPVFVIFLVWILHKKKPGKEAVITCFFVLCGILCFFFDRLTPSGMIGNLLALLSGFCYALVFLMKSFPEGDFESSLVVSHVLSILVGIPFFMQETAFSPTILGMILLLGVVQFGFSYIFLSKGLDIVSPVTASLTSTIEPVLNPVLVALFCNETIGGMSIIGAILVIGAATVYNVRQAVKTEE